MKISFIALVLIFLAVFYGSPGFADTVYRWVDKDGKVHFSDRYKHPDSTRLQIEVDPIGTDQKQQQKNKKYFSKTSSGKIKKAKTRDSYRKVSLSSCEKLSVKIEDEKIKLKVHKRQGMKHSLEKKAKRLIRTLEEKYRRRC